VRVRRSILAVAAIAAAAGAAAAPAATPNRSVVASDDRGDAAPGAPDLTRLALRRFSRERIRASLTLAGDLTAAGLRAENGPPGSLCVKLWTASDPPDEVPDYLVCVTARADGRRLRAGVLRERPNQLPERVAGATITRPSARSLRIFFAQSAIGRPAAVDAAAEATAPGCMRSTCVDTAPDAPGTVRLRLRKAATVHA
jgi:hypothetical protein